ncbi:MAG: hypothetical protein AB8G95_19780 [Anaerolineae bacterium]
MSQENKNSMDQILDLLLDALQERQHKRNGPEHDGPTEFEPEIETAVTQPGNPPIALEEVAEPALGPDLLGPAESSEATEAEDVEIDDFLENYNLIPEKLPSINMNKIFYRLSIAVALIIVIVNIPFNRYGTNLARAMPDEQALIVRDGLIFTGPGDEIYILENNQKRWISSLTAFELSGFSWSQVREVEQTFVDQFEDGPNFNVIIRCDSQPHIYMLEGNEKRWIENPTEFEKAGLKWDDVRYISCFDLKNKYPDGTPIPADAGEPPTW